MMKSTGILRKSSEDSRQSFPTAATTTTIEEYGSRETNPSIVTSQSDKYSVRFFDEDSSSYLVPNYDQMTTELPASNMATEKVRFTYNKNDISNALPEEDEDYSASLSAILQRRVSSRRGKRRVSSPFAHEDISAHSSPRRRSSAFTITSTETAMSTEETVVTQEQMYENIRLHKEVISSVKLQPWSMRRKLKLVQQAKAYVKKHEGELQVRLKQSRSTRDILARFNIVLIKKWQHTKRELANTMNVLIPWELRIKEVESHFGSVVASYFIFLRWLFWVNLVISTIMTAFVIMPEVLLNKHKDAGERKEPLEEEKTSKLDTFLNFDGVFKYSALFYGYYSNVEDDKGYRLPTIYFVVGLIVYVYSFIATLRKMAINFRLSKLSEKEDECIFTWKLFTGWDYMIGNAETAHNRTSSIVLGFKEALLEEAEKKKEKQSWKIITLRVFVNINVFWMLICSALAVVYVVHKSNNAENVPPPEDESFLMKLWRQNELSIVMTAVGNVFPVIFEGFGVLERYHPRKTLRIQLARIMALNLLTLYTMTISLFVQINGKTIELQQIRTNLTQNNTCKLNDTFSNSYRTIVTPTMTSARNLQKRSVNTSTELDSNDMYLPKYEDSTEFGKNNAETVKDKSMNNYPVVNKPYSDSSNISGFSNDTVVTVFSNSSTTTPSEVMSFLDKEFPDPAHPRHNDTGNTERPEKYSDDPADYDDLSTVTTDRKTGVTGDKSAAEISATQAYEQTKSTKWKSVEYLTSEITEETETNSTAWSVTTSAMSTSLGQGHLEDFYRSTEVVDPFTSLQTEDATIFPTLSENKTSSEEFEGETSLSTKSKNTTPVTEFKTTELTSTHITETITTRSAAQSEGDASDNTELPSTSTDRSVSSATPVDQSTTPVTKFTKADEQNQTSQITDNSTSETSFVATVPTTTDETSSYKSSASEKPSTRATITTVEGTSYTGSKLPDEVASSLAVTDTPKTSTGTPEQCSSSSGESDRRKKDLSEKVRKLDTPTRLKLRRLCWETMFGQELVKITVMDLVTTIGSTFFSDFIRALLVRYMNKCWCWDLEKKFPKYGDFKIAENILHLVNNQGLVWMGMFFSPGLPLINTVKLIIMMYLRSWAVLTCNVPHEVVFRASRSNNFYLALLLTMLFLCVLPVGYAIVRLEPSWHCGPFSNHEKIYFVFTTNVRQLVPPPFHFIIDYIASPGTVIPLLLILLLIIYYLASLTSALREANNDLKVQLRRERTEERKKMFQMANRRRRGGSEVDSTLAKWRQILHDVPSTKLSVEDISQLNKDEEKFHSEDERFGGKKVYGKKLLENRINEDDTDLESGSLVHDEVFAIAKVKKNVLKRQKRKSTADAKWNLLTKELAKQKDSLTAAGTENKQLHSSSSSSNKDVIDEMSVWSNNIPEIKISHTQTVEKHYLTAASKKQGPVQSEDIGTTREEDDHLFELGSDQKRLQQTDSESSSPDDTDNDVVVRPKKSFNLSKYDSDEEKRRLDEEVYDIFNPDAEKDYSSIKPDLDKKTISKTKRRALMKEMSVQSSGETQVAQLPTDAKTVTKEDSEQKLKEHIPTERKSMKDQMQKSRTLVTEKETSDKEKTSKKYKKRLSEDGAKITKK